MTRGILNFILLWLVWTDSTPQFTYYYNVYYKQHLEDPWMLYDQTKECQELVDTTQTTGFFTVASVTTEGELFAR